MTFYQRPNNIKSLLMNFKAFVITTVPFCRYPMLIVRRNAFFKYGGIR